MEDILETIVATNTAQVNDQAFVEELKSWTRFSYGEAISARNGLFYRCVPDAYVEPGSSPNHLIPDAYLDAGATRSRLADWHVITAFEGIDFSVIAHIFRVQSKRPILYLGQYFYR